MNSLNAPQIIPVAKSSVPYTPFQSLWIPNSSKFVVLGENPRRTGNISIYQLQFQSNGNNDINDEKKSDENVNKSNKKQEKETLKLLKRESKDFGFKCGTFGQSYNKENIPSKQLATGDFDGNLNIWDLENLNKPIFEIKKAHEKIINCIDGISGKHGAAEIVTGSRDGTVKVWDPRTDKHVSEMRPSSNNQARDCWSVCFGNSYDALNRMVCAGYDNGDCKILDLRMNKLYFECNVRNGICSLEFDRNNIKANKLVITTLESQFRIYDMKTKHIAEGFAYLNVDTKINNDMDNEKKKQGTTIWNVRHLPQNRDIWCTAQGNGIVNVWKYIYPDERYIVDDKGHKKGVMGECKLLTNKSLSSLSTQPIISWNWNKDKLGLACLSSLDQTIQVVIVTKLNKF